MWIYLICLLGLGFSIYNLMIEPTLKLINDGYTIKIERIDGSIQIIATKEDTDNG